MKLNKIVIVAAALCSASALNFTGCVQNPGGGLVISDQNKTLAKAIVEVAVSEYVVKNPSRGADIVAIAEEIKKVAGTEGFNTVDLLVGAIKLKANIASLTPQQQILANALIQVIADRLKAQFPSGNIGSANLVQVVEIAGWVEEGATIVQTK